MRAAHSATAANPARRAASAIRGWVARACAVVAAPGASASRFATASLLLNSHRWRAGSARAWSISRRPCASGLGVRPTFVGVVFALVFAFGYTRGRFPAPPGPKWQAHRNPLGSGWPVALLLPVTSLAHEPAARARETLRLLGDSLPALAPPVLERVVDASTWENE